MENFHLTPILIVSCGIKVSVEIVMKLKVCCVSAELFCNANHISKQRENTFHKGRICKNKNL
ncbi:hypothetical protein T01_3765 [Trichinella spiralis]|uniref:Uncharacterized protein n=1 Tax=Trichinella spiralis TaxID=6334 RepID=A0A0V1BIZ5_TRISP|nr:hypothetical protein T01_3765 [Trichinella spiralis]